MIQKISALIIIIFSLLRFVNIESDFPRKYIDGGFVFTDEGWYCNAAIAKINTGKWQGEGFQSMPIIPVNHLIQYATMSLFGVSATTTRATVSVFFCMFITAVYLCLRKIYGSKTSLAPIVVLAASSYLFAYSRIALLEIEMLFFVTVSILFALNKKWLPAAVFTVVALLTKTTAMFCIIPIAYLLFDNRKRALYYLVSVFAVYGIYMLEVRSLFPDAFASFFGSNVSGRAKVSILSSISNVALFDTVLFALFVASFGLLKRNRMLNFYALLFLFGVVMIGMNGYQPNRYFAILVVPMAFVIAEGLNNSGSRLKHEVIIVAVSILFNLKPIIDTLQPRYTMRNFCRSMSEMKDVGPSSSTISMFNGGKGRKECFIARQSDMKLAEAYKPRTGKSTVVYGQQITVFER